MTTQRFNFLTILSRDGKYANCRCDCGDEKRALFSNIRAGYTKSCGCLQKRATSTANTKHGLARTPLYAVWRAMHRRCYNVQHEAYQWYGGKGIKVCDEWHDFENFLRDMAKGYEPGLTIDRKESHKDYYKENCQWLTKSQNSGKREPNEPNP